MKVQVMIKKIKSGVFKKIVGIFFFFIEAGSFFLLFV